MNYITWLYFLKEKKTKTITFLYGLSLPTNNDVSDTREHTTKINKQQSIVVYTTISNITLIKNDKLNFSIFIKEEKYASDIIGIKKTILVSREVDREIPSSILNVPLNTTTFYTKDIHEYIEENSIEKLNPILEKLSMVSAQNFVGNYLKRIGCYEIGEIQEWIENRNSIFELGQNIDKKNNKREYFFEKKDGYLYETYFIHLIVYNRDNEILFDTIHDIKKDDKVTSLLFTRMKEDASFEYWVFNDRDELIARENIHFILFGSISTSIIEAKYTLPKETFDKKSPLSKKDSEVQVSTSTSHNVGYDRNQFNIQEKNRNLYTIVQKFNQKDDITKYGKWFIKEKYNELIDFFNDITKNGSYKLILIDPFISESACLDYFYHLKNLQIDLQFISCWAKNISPDDKSVKETADEHIQIFKKRLDSIQDYQIPLKNTIWYNFKEKKFHDRFIYVKNETSKKISIYTISNSLNNMLINYENLSIIPLHGSVLTNAEKYIKNLLSQCNDTNKIYPIKGED